MTILWRILFVIFSTLNSVLSCNTDDECSYNGVCSNNACVCDAGWLGDDCGILDLRPGPRSNGYNMNAQGTSSWGAKIIHDRKDSNLYHLFAAEFVNGCGLDSWSPFSRIIRAESRTGPIGPYKFAAEVVGTFAHNPTVIYSPADDAYFLFHIGCSHTVPPSGCNGGPNFQCGAGNNIQGESGVTILESQDLLSWDKKANLSGGPSGSWYEDLTNPSPWPFVTKYGDEEGTNMIVAFRGCQFNGAGAEQIGIAHTYTKGVLEPFFIESVPLFPDHNEDPFIWMDKRGHFHLLMHYVDPSNGGGFNGQPNVGRHAYAWCWNCTWTFNSHTVAYHTTVDFTDGTSTTYYRRERPQLYFSEDGNMTPLYLVNGVQEQNTPQSYTLVQPIGGK